MYASGWGMLMWLSLLVLVAPALADQIDDYRELERHAPTEALVVERYANLLDAELVRRLGRRTLAANPDENGARNLLSGAAGEAAVDWSVWVLRRVPTPSLDLPLPSFHRKSKARRPVQHDPVATAQPPEGSEIGETPRQHPAARHVPSPAKRVEPTFDLALSPSLPREGSEDKVDAVVRATAGLGPASVRLASKPLSQTWSLWLRQDLAHGISVVAAADSAAKKSKPAGFSGGTLLRIPGEQWRLFARYAHKLPRKEQAREHVVALRVSVVPERKKRKKKSRNTKS